jgi:hypothetical protein
MTLMMEKRNTDNRRQVPRTRRSLPVHVIDADGDFSVITGRSLDVGLGGLRIVLPGPLRAAADVLVQVDLPDGGQVIANARIADAEQHHGGFAYRLIFLDLGEDDLSSLLWIALPTGW